MTQSLRLLLILMAALVGLPAAARQSPDVGWISAQALPLEARETLALIRQGGPFPFRKDGSVFNNREGRLPARPRGYYREYTVPTPGERDRGARRIIAGSGPAGDVREANEYYYTADHYRSFRRIRQ